MLPCFRLSLPTSHWLSNVLKLATWNQVPMLYKKGSLVSRPTVSVVSLIIPRQEGARYHILIPRQEGARYHILIPWEEGASIESVYHERKEPVSNPYTMRGRNQCCILIPWGEGASIVSLYHKRKEPVLHPYTTRGRSQVLYPYTMRGRRILPYFFDQVLHIFFTARFCAAPIWGWRLIFWKVCRYQWWLEEVHTSDAVMLSVVSASSQSCGQPWKQVVQHE